MKEIKQNNILLAKFLGWKEQTDPTERWLGAFRTSEGIVHKNTNVEPLLFHSSWDWLIWVVEKIESLDVTVEIEGHNCMISDINGSGYHQYVAHDSKINAVYVSVVAFIKWYNDNK